MNKRKRTKIVATLGPATATANMIERLIVVGVNAFRLNFSHGTHESHAQLIQWIKEKREKLNLPVAILQDLGGPKIRVGKISESYLELNPGDELVFDTALEINSGKTLPVTYKNFAEDVEEGHMLLLADGSIQLKIMKVESAKVFCEVRVGGKLSSHKGINYPDGSFNLPAITEKDKEDLKFGLRQGVDYVALSFVKTPADVEIAREICRSEKKSVPLIAKIEKHEAVNNFQEILNCVDGVMVARGDLGVEMPLERVPLIQKKIIQIANSHGKPVITATQMLLSMVNAPRPTRAEATDITNAIFDGTDAIMLSEETATGNYPIQAVETMNRIARETELHFPYYRLPATKESSMELDVPKAISGSACSLAEKLKASAILCPTASGFTARMISRFRPRALVVALTSNRQTYYQMSLLWGVTPKFFSMEYRMEEILQNALIISRQEGLLKPGNRYVITAGFPFGKGGPTNLIYAGEIGEED